MSAKKQQGKRPGRGAGKRDATPAENRSAEAATVLWMLSLLATLGADLLALAGWLCLTLTPLGQGAPELIRGLPGLLLLTGAMTGLVCLGLIPLVYKLRLVKPPRAITSVAVVASVAPLVALLVLALVKLL